MSQVCISVENLSKQFRLGTHFTYSRFSELLQGAVAKGILLPLRRMTGAQPSQSTTDNLIWALRDVSFSVEQGEVLGIIGSNGAGKSTLLKVLSRIMRPTSGRIGIGGRVGSLLEVGTGFHPELTGRENVYLNGAILGMSRREVRRKFDEIVAFSELERFLDTPVKRYSSGMYMRLAFSVAAHLEPEILLVDEVLAVGDASFQKRCLAKMSNLSQLGRTVVFVSHNLVAVRKLCSRAIWLHEGELRSQGDPASLVSEYLSGDGSGATERTWEDINSAPGNDLVRLRKVAVRPLDSTTSGTITTRTAFAMEFEYWNLVPGSHLNPRVELFDEELVTVFNSIPVREPNWHGKPFPSGLFRSVCHVPGDLLNDGQYTAAFILVLDQSKRAYRFDDVFQFRVEDDSDRQHWFGKWIGVVRPDLDWETTLLETPLDDPDERSGLRASC